MFGSADEHFRVEGRNTWFETVEEMQAVLDADLVGYNTKRPTMDAALTAARPKRRSATAF